MRSISVFLQPSMVYILCASFDGQEGIYRPSLFCFSSWNLNDSLEADLCLEEHFVPHTPLELWDSSALEQRQALIPNTMVTMLVLFLLWNKDSKVNKPEFNVRSALSLHFSAGSIMTVLSKYANYIYCIQTAVSQGYLHV